MKTASTVLLLGFLNSMGLWAFARGRQFNRAAAYRTGCYVISTAALFSHVLSPQYFIWIIPLWILLGAGLMPERIVAQWILAGLMVIAAALATWIFPYHYYYDAESPNGLVVWPFVEGCVPSNIASAIVGARNLLSLTVAIWLGMLLVRRERQAVAATPPVADPLPT
jgi:hypothetical protein